MVRKPIKNKVAAKKSGTSAAGRKIVGKITPHLIICDDVRAETNRKMSLIGIYGSQILVGTIPYTFPKLCFFIEIKREGRTPIKKMAIQIAIPGGDPIDLNIDVPKTLKDDPSVQAARKLGYFAVMFPLVASPFLISGEGKISLKATVDGQNIELGHAMVLHVPALADGPIR